jgi:Na+-transporting NADH:ubiquinone oxidoreductase subunit B
LIVAGIASARIMVGCVVGVVCTAALCNGLAGPDSLALMSLPPHYHLVMGGFAFGAVFMATDPCTSAVTPLGRWIYGFLIGALCVMVRVVNPAYPEGMMLAVLFMNVFAPLIDYFIVKRTTRRRMTRLAAT